MEAFLVSTGIVALAEIGDKTQIATIALAAQYQAVFAVVVGTTLGMLIANVPARASASEKSALAGRRHMPFTKRYNCQVIDRIPLSLLETGACALITYRKELKCRSCSLP